MQRWILYAALAAIVLAGCRQPGAEEKGTSLPETAFEPGQLWQYRTRPDETASRVLIQRVEQHEKLGEIVHIRLNNLHFQGPKATVPVLPHLPYSAEALRKCLTGLESRGNEVPAEYLEGYQIWKNAFDAGEAGVFTADVAGILDEMEKHIAR